MFGIPSNFMSWIAISTTISILLDKSVSFNRYALNSMYTPEINDGFKYIEHPSDISSLIILYLLMNLVNKKIHQIYNMLRPLNCLCPNNHSMTWYLNIHHFEWSSRFKNSARFFISPVWYPNSINFHSKYQINPEM